ncbi:MAG: hydrogenase formation protein HypD [Nitrososphaeria archaeon]
MEWLKDSNLIRGIVDKIGEHNVKLNFMHACGTHQETLVKYGLDSLFSKVGIAVRSGPGCPVCITTAKEFVEIMSLGERGKLITAYGDCLRVPVNQRSLMSLREEGYDVRIVYSIEDAAKIAEEENRDVIFMAIGFETTAPSTASILLRDNLPENFYVLSCHRFFLPAMVKLLEMGEIKLQGLIEPGHVSAIIGTSPYKYIRDRFCIPQVISGFEPLDMALSIYELVSQYLDDEPKVENEYKRVVPAEGNVIAMRRIEEVFEKADIEWRGFPTISKSSMKIREKYSAHDASKQFEDILNKIRYEPSKVEMDCRCGEVLRGLIEPKECPLFSRACSLENPIGACMVSIEGSCRIQLEFGQTKEDRSQ